jgi:hypothetical protein
LRIGHIDHVVLVDGDVARPAELLPFGDEFSIRLENLHAVVGAVGDVDPSCGIERDIATVSIVVTPTATPLPAALPLFASGLGVMGLLGWRRKRKTAAQAAA